MFPNPGTLRDSCLGAGGGWLIYESNADSENSF